MGQVCRRRPGFVPELDRVAAPLLADRSPYRGRLWREPDPGVDLVTTTVFTVGHGTLAADALAALLRDAGVGGIVDVRSFPGSRRNPQFGREAMEQWVPAAGLDYAWVRRLGGRRPVAATSRHVALREEAFRGYADHMETADFLAGVDELLGLAERRPSAAMCSESVWWRCHRRLLADHLTLVRAVQVTHLLHDGRLVPHPVTAGARLAVDTVVYDVGVSRPLPDLDTGDSRR